MNDFNTVRAKVGGLRGLMQKLGDAPAHDHKWKSMDRCPFCEAKGKAGVFNKGGTDFFKCHGPGCSSGNECVAEIGYIRLRKGLSDEKPATGGPSPAYKFFLELAGCYEEPKKEPPHQIPCSLPPLPIAPTEPRPGTSPQRGEGENNSALPNPVIPPEVVPPVLPENTPPVENESSKAKPGVDDEQIILQGIEIVLGERRASVSLLQRRLSVGYTRASRIMDELEKRGIVGPSKGAEPRDILIPEKDAPSREAKSEETPEVPPGRLALMEFYSQLKLSAADDRMIFEKRGLTRDTNQRLGFVSSPVENKGLLMELRNKFSADDLVEAGLFLPQDKKRKKEFRPNSQFYGMGQKGKKPKEQRQSRDDRWLWGMMHPVIIPYFDEGGQLLKLRPHKGGAPGNTLCGASRIYVPRDYRKAPDTVENFPRVVITEGEFKAAALWQMVGAGRGDIEDIGRPGQAWGVCAIPGINFGNNYDLRCDLEVWLQSVQCRLVVVAFDDQDKTGRPMRERYEALIWARFLASSLAQKLHVRAKVLVLPTGWRDDKGKADWDGALAGMLAGKIKT